MISDAIDEAGEPFRPYGQSGPLVRAVADTIVRSRYYSRIAEMPKPDDTPEKLAERQRKGFNLAIKASIDAKRVFAAEHEARRVLWLP